MLIRLLLATSLLVASSIRAQNPKVDVLHYRIEITLPAEGAVIEATTELTIRPMAGELDALQLDFSGMTIDAVFVDGAPARHERNGNQLTIDTRRRSAEPFRVAVRYHGKPVAGLLLRPNRHGDPAVFADNWPNRARHWIPSVDHPSDKATVEFLVTAPVSYSVIANGSLLETVALAGGSKRTHWSESTPIPVHCMVIGATAFSVQTVGAPDGTELSYWLYPRDREAGARQLGRAPAMLAFYVSTVGAYPYSKLALVQSSTRFGGMENASAIFLNEKRIGTEQSLEGLVAHEIAHQWFGDSITQRQWPDLWLSEGFSTYFGHLFFERADGRAVFLEKMGQSRQKYLTAEHQQSRAIHDPAITDPSQLLGAFTYDKAAWVLHMLRGILGDAAFFAAVRDYYAAYRDRNASTGELRVIMERHAGQPLDWFFQHWIFGRGHPVLSLRWSWKDGRALVQIEQMQSGAHFRVPLVIEVRAPGVAQRLNVLLDERVESVEIESAQRPDAVVLDPDGWVLWENAQDSPPS